MSLLHEGFLQRLLSIDSACASHCGGFSFARAWTSVAEVPGPSCPAACGIFPDQRSNSYALHWQADSQPLDHQQSPKQIHLVTQSVKHKLQNKTSLSSNPNITIYKLCDLNYTVTLNPSFLSCKMITMPPAQRAIVESMGHLTTFGFNY